MTPDPAAVRQLRLEIIKAILSAPDVRAPDVVAAAKAIEEYVLGEKA